MKRWLRRILLACSIGLMLAAVALTIRGMSVEDFYSVHSIVVGTSRFGAGFLVDYTGAFPVGISHKSPRVLFTWEYLFINSKLATPNRALFIPHWIPFLVGAIFPMAVWFRHQRRKKDAGFPVEVSCQRAAR